ncbi:MAG TPA: hypothetical protein VM935_09030, partial [Chitinophagaceae bacterium]|nr:hypothetical protein [Chitinophagaceae bacterium]
MKMKSSTLGFFFYFLFLMGIGAVAQENTAQLIRGDFRGVTIDEFIRQVEAKTNYHFYFDPKHFDLLILNIEAKDITLDRLLKEAFKSSDYNYAIDGNRVFLLKGAAIKTNLSAA